MSCLRLCLVTLSCLPLVYNLGLNEERDATVGLWLAGYKLFFLLAGVKSLGSYVYTHLTSAAQLTRDMQRFALATTSGNRVFAIHYEDRLVNGATEYVSLLSQNRTPCDFAEEKECSHPLFWCMFFAALLMYNTVHLAAVPLGNAEPLLFGAPLYCILWRITKGTRGGLLESQRIVSVD